MAYKETFADSLNMIPKALKWNELTPFEIASCVLAGNFFIETISFSFLITFFSSI